MRRILARHNLELGKDVSIRAVQTTPAEIATLKSGGAKGFMAYPPDDVQAKRAGPGFHSSFDPRELNITYVQASVFTTKSFLSANRPTMVKVMQAMAEAISFEKESPDFATNKP